MSLKRSTFNWAFLKAVSCVPTKNLPKFPDMPIKVFLCLKTLSPSALPSVGSISFSICIKKLRLSDSFNLDLKPNLEALFKVSVSVSRHRQFELCSY